MVCLYIRLPSHLLFNVHNILRRSLCRAFSVLVCNESSPIWCKLFQAKTETLRIDEMKKSRAAYTQRSMGRERRKAREKTTIQLAMEINLCGFQQCVVCNIEERTANTIISASLVGISHPDSLHLPSPEKA